MLFFMILYYTLPVTNAANYRSGMQQPFQSCRIGELIRRSGGLTLTECVRTWGWLMILLCCLSPLRSDYGLATIPPSRSCCPATPTPLWQRPGPGTFYAAGIFRISYNG